MHTCSGRGTSTGGPESATLVGAAAPASAPAAAPKGKVVKAKPNSTELFAHLQQYKQVTASQVLSHHHHAGRDAGTVHPAVLQLGLRYANGTIKGANARCMAMLNALSHVS